MTILIGLQHLCSSCVLAMWTGKAHYFQTKYYMQYMQEPKESFPFPNRCRGILQRVAILPNSPFIWPMLSQNTMQLTASINQHLQGLLAEFLPKAYNALQVGLRWKWYDLMRWKWSTLILMPMGCRGQAFHGGLLQRGSLVKLSCRLFLWRSCHTCWP